MAKKVEVWTDDDTELLRKASEKLWEVDEEKMLEDLKTELAKDIASDIASIDRILPSVISPMVFATSKYYPDAHTQMIEHQIETMLKRMYEEIDTRWEMKQPSGRLHIPTMMRAKALGVPTVRLFRRRERSAIEQAKMGIFFCIDCSGSMTSTVPITEKVYKKRVEVAKDAVWAMATAFEKMDSLVGVATFAHLKDSEFIKDFGTAGYWDFGTAGENSPHIALQWGEGLLRRLRLTENVENLLLVVMADGAWSSSTESTESAKRAATQFKRLNIEGLIETMEIHVGASDSAEWLSPKYHIRIKNFMDFPKQLAEVMQNIQRGIVRKLMA